MSGNFHPRGKKLPYQLSAAFQTLFTSDAEPSSDELAAIVESVRIAHTVRAQLSVQLTEARLTLLRLEREEMHATRHIERCKPPLAPLRRIPNEMLSEIFVRYAADVSLTRLWILGHICHRWREIAHATPGVWSSFVYRCDKEEYNSKVLALEFLRRAKISKAPLSIDFCCHEPFTHQEDACRAVLDAVLALSPQWAMAKFNIVPSFYASMRMVKDSLPNLTRLQLRLDDSDANPIQFDTETFRSCPRLVDVDVEWVPENSIAFPWHQLTRYRGAASWGSVSLLALAPHLIDCTLHIYEAHTLTAKMIHPLRNLHLWIGHDETLFDNLDLPMLETLSFCPDPRVTLPLAALLRRSASPLRALRISATNKRESLAGVVDVLAAVPTLTYLYIRGDGKNRDATSELFDRLAQPHGSTVPPILPRLKDLETLDIPFNDSFFRMVESRSGRDVSGTQVCRLESLNVRDYRHRDGEQCLTCEQCLRVRRACMEFGLKSKISYLEEADI